MLYALVSAFIVQSILYHFVLDRMSSRTDLVIANLCQRLQAPEAAVAQHVVGESVYEPQHLPFDDDGAWLAYVGKQPMIGTDDLG